MERPSAPMQHIVAMRLNNQASSLIVTGHYDQAIKTLVKSLKLSEAVGDIEDCTCKSCRLEECIRRTHRSSSFRKLVDTQESAASTWCGPCDGALAKPAKTDSSVEQEEYESVQSSSPSLPAAAHDETCDSDDDTFVYRHPITVASETIREEHTLGTTLSLVIIFNLALAHHLNALEHGASRSMLQKAVQLYELAYQLHLDEIDDSSAIFTLIMANNLGQVHNTVRNTNKYRLCLEHLLSTMMFLVDCDDTEVPCLEGFLRNTSRLVLREIVAPAA